uniref:Uncharacterized protein n=1 Tax=Anguilla anguilla TaxID=7936 RepID=A0A0E9RQL6_ANGAN
MCKKKFNLYICNFL